MPSQEFMRDWPLTPITDPEVIKRTSEITGVYPLPEEKQAWVSKYTRQLLHEGKPFSTYDLVKEYEVRKANGTLDDVFK